MNNTCSICFSEENEKNLSGNTLPIIPLLSSKSDDLGILIQPCETCRNIFIHEKCLATWRSDSENIVNGALLCMQCKKKYVFESNINFDCHKILIKLGLIFRDIIILSLLFIPFLIIYTFGIYINIKHEYSFGYWILSLLLCSIVNYFTIIIFLLTFIILAEKCNIYYDIAKLKRLSSVTEFVCKNLNICLKPLFSKYYIFCNILLFFLIITILFVMMFVSVIFGMYIFVVSMMLETILYHTRSIFVEMYQVKNFNDSLQP